MTPWFIRRFWRMIRVIRLGSRVAMSFFNPFDPLFMHPLAFEMWYFMTHEQEAAEQMNAAVAEGNAVVAYPLADDQVTDESVDWDLKMFLEEAEAGQMSERTQTLKNQSINAFRPRVSP